MLSLVGSLLIGGGLGAALGYFGKCSSGTCPLTSTWWRGAIYGAVLGLIFYMVSGSGGSASINESTQNVKRISESQFEAEVEQAALPVVVDFYAPWCGPCKTLSPRLDELAGPLTNKVKFVKINVDEAPALAQRLEIQGVPTLVFFKSGKVVDSLIGLPSSDILKVRLELLAKVDAAPTVN
jgi:thioredoxin 1